MCDDLPPCAGGTDGDCNVWTGDSGEGEEEEDIGQPGGGGAGESSSVCMPNDYDAAVSDPGTCAQGQGGDGGGCGGGFFDEDGCDPEWTEPEPEE